MDQWIVILCDQNGGQHHAVGVDCKTGLIWDHTERFSLKLTLENLNRCCGESNTLEKISQMAQLVRKKQGKKRKHV